MPVPGFTRDNLKRHHNLRGPVVVGIPMTEMIYREAFWPFMFLVRDGMKEGDRLIPTIQVAVPAEARNSIIEDFLAMPAHFRFLFMFDSDMVVPMEAIDAMSGYDVPFVSGYCTYKNPPYFPVASVKDQVITLHGEQVQTYRNITNWEPFQGIHECDATGAAALCLRRDLLEAIEPPYFKHEAGGEDYYFCRKVQAARLPGYEDGVPILLSTDIPIGHIGLRTAWPMDWFTHKDAYYAEHPENAEIDAVVVGIQPEVAAAD